jgi:hypothetical protein
MPTTITLSPVVTDDGFGGLLSFAWTQLSGPATADIVTPSGTQTSGPAGFFDPAVFDPAVFDVYGIPALDASTVVICPDDADGVYLFQVTITRADGFASASLWRVVVYTGQAVAHTENRGPATLTVNGVPTNVIINTLATTDSLTSTPSCQFVIYGGSTRESFTFPIAVGDEIAVTRGGPVLFAGIVLSVAIGGSSGGITEGQIFAVVNATGFAWQLTRTRVTFDYATTTKVPPLEGITTQGWLIPEIVADLVSRAQGGIIAGTLVTAGAGQTATIAFADVTIFDALQQLADLCSGPLGRAHVRVDYAKQLHFCVLESANDPVPLTPRHPSFRNLLLKQDGGPTVQQVTVRYDQVVVVPITIDSALAVSDLNPYLPKPIGTPLGNGVTSTGTYPRGGLSATNVPLTEGGVLVPPLVLQYATDGTPFVVDTQTGTVYTAGPPTSADPRVVTVDAPVVRYTGTSAGPITPDSLDVHLLGLDPQCTPVATGGGSLPGPTFLGKIALDPALDPLNPAGTAARAAATAPSPDDLVGYAYAAAGAEDLEEIVYTFTIVTDLGETAIMASTGAYCTASLPAPDGTEFHTLTPYYWAPVDPTLLVDAIEIRMKVTGSPSAIKRIRSFNVYKNGLAGVQRIGSIPSLDGSFVDTRTPAQLPLQAGLELGGRNPAWIPPPPLDTAEIPIVDPILPPVYFGEAPPTGPPPAVPGSLTGCTAYVLLHLPTTYTASGGTAIAGGSTGVSVTLGSMDAASAQAAAAALLAELGDLIQTATFESQDDLSQPGAVISIRLPAPIGNVDLLIQQVRVTGFELGLPHYWSVTAAPTLWTLTDLLQTFST